MRWSLILACMLVLAGCADQTDDGEREPREGDAASSATLDHDGQGDGSHEEEALCEDGTGQLTGAGSIQAGSVEVRVRDGQGELLYSQAYDDDWEGEGEAFDATGGTWVLEAERSGGFDGQYGFTLTCS